MYTLKVTRPFYLSGTVQELGSVFQTRDKALAFELRYNGKVEFVEAPAHKGAMTTETVGSMVHGHKHAADDPKPEPEKKGKHHES